MKKNAVTNYVVHPLIEARWSPMAFEEQQISEQQIRSIFEAARWSHSTRNEQPWRFIVANRLSHPKVFKSILSALDETNQAWAVRSSVLAISFAKKNFDEDDSENRHAWYDVGLATAQLTMQASQYGISIHQMTDFDTEKVCSDFKVPENYEPVVSMAFGFVGNPKTLTAELEKKERAPRVRIPQPKFVFGKRWGSPFVG